MTPAQLAKFLGVTLRTVKRWQAAKVIPEPQRDDNGRATWSHDQVSEILNWHMERIPRRRRGDKEG